MIQTLPSPFRKWNAIHSSWEKLWPLSGKSHQPLWWCSKAGNLQKLLKQKNGISGFSLMISNPKSRSCMLEDRTKTLKCCLHSNKCFLRPCTHGNSPIATGRSHLQEWVCGHLRWDTQALQRLVPLCFQSLFTDYPRWLNKENASEIVKNAISLCHRQTFSLCSLMLLSWTCTHGKGFFPLMKGTTGCTGICLTLHITMFKMRSPTQPDKISDGQRACAGKCIYLKQILPAASGKTTTYE